MCGLGSVLGGGRRRIMLVHLVGDHLITYTCIALRCVKDWVRNGPSLRYAKKKF